MTIIVQTPEKHNFETNLVNSYYPYQLKLYD